MTIRSAATDQELLWRAIKLVGRSFGPNVSASFAANSNFSAAGEGRRHGWVRQPQRSIAAPSEIVRSDPRKSRKALEFVLGFQLSGVLRTIA
jgi:hypothetical protein